MLQNKDTWPWNIPLENCPAFRFLDSCQRLRPAKSQDKNTRDLNLSVRFCCGDLVLGVQWPKWRLRDKATPFECGLPGSRASVLRSLHLEEQQPLLFHCLTVGNCSLEHSVPVLTHEVFPRTWAKRHKWLSTLQGYSHLFCGLMLYLKVVMDDAWLFSTTEILVPGFTQSSQAASKQPLRNIILLLLFLISP